MSLTMEQSSNVLNQNPKNRLWKFVDDSNIGLIKDTEYRLVFGPYIGQAHKEGFFADLVKDGTILEEQEIVNAQLADDAKTDLLDEEEAMKKILWSIFESTADPGV